MLLASKNVHWQQVCRGELCCLCEVPLPRPCEAGMRYCSTCAPTPALTPHRIHIHADHCDDAWMVVLSARGHIDLSYWMVNVSTAALDQLLSRVRIAPTERRMYAYAMRAWHRGGVYAHLTRRQARLFVWACRRDRRNGYEKLHGLRAGASRRGWR